MAILFKDVLGHLKGGGKENETITGKKSFSHSGFQQFVNALVNDPSHKVTHYDKDQNPVTTNIRERVVSDLKQSIQNAGYPQKSEMSIVNNSEIATKNLATIIPSIVMEYMKTGRKFPLPRQENSSGEIYLHNVNGKTRTVPVRDMKTGKPLGTSTIETQAYVQVRVKSPPPKHLVTKTRKDVNGNIVNN